MICLVLVHSQIFRLVITPDAGRFAAPIHDLLKGTDNALGGKREVHLDAQRLAVEIALDVAQVQKASPETPGTIHAVELLNEKILLLIALGFSGDFFLSTRISMQHSDFR
ncbi:hypothetical protein AXE65_04750 [Ventosimonas gracilis]|uniref:Uncharacterized protein n=1 Tax=Ventosimonas gracilis TaxID=1680762 RepID=A0A139SQJ0_9GAMM|nr:hypothetical protein AXE65_04750 [Ventosimonas gracilis]